MKFARKIEREREKEKVKDIHRTYEKNPKQKCPNCHKKSLFFTNTDGEIKTTPTIKLEIVDNSKLESVLYEEK